MLGNLSGFRVASDHFLWHFRFIEDSVDAHKPSLRTEGFLKVCQFDSLLSDDSVSDRVIAFLIISTELDLAISIVTELVHEAVSESL